MGYLAGAAVTTGVQNTLIGSLAGDSLTDADYNTVVGMQALNNDTLGSTSTAIGAFTLNNQNFTSATILLTRQLDIPQVYQSAQGFATPSSVVLRVMQLLQPMTMLLWVRVL
jgi:phosphoenolpyruvate-protein kinase (PTS system EI component)